jgi:hypothetical protein
MRHFVDLVEQRIRTAMAQGAFDDLPGRGRPLDLDDDALVPEDLRLAYRVLRNAGYVPEELELRREIADIEALLEQAPEGEDRRLANKRLALLRTRLAVRGGDRPVHLDAEYDHRIRRRLAGDP